MIVLFKINHVPLVLNLLCIHVFVNLRAEDGGDLKMGIPQASPRVSVTSCGSELSLLTMPTMSDWRQRAVMIENVPQKYLSAVLDRLENRSRGGGRVESHYTDRLDSQKLVVVFAHRQGYWTL